MFHLTIFAMEKERFRGRKYGFEEGIITKIAKSLSVSRPTVYRYLLNPPARTRLSAEKRQVLETYCSLLHLHHGIDMSEKGGNDEQVDN